MEYSDVLAWHDDVPLHRMIADPDKASSFQNTPKYFYTRHKDLERYRKEPDWKRPSVALPKYTLTSPPDGDFGFPPALIPLWSNGAWPGYVGLIKHWFGDKPDSYVQYFVEDSEYTEIAYGIEQFLAFMVFDFLCNVPEFDEIVAFARSVGFTGAENIREFFDGCERPSDLIRLECFKNNPPKAVSGGDDSPDWLVDDATPKALDEAMASGDHERAWYLLNSQRLPKSKAAKVLREMLPHAKDQTGFAALISCYAPRTLLVRNAGEVLEAYAAGVRAFPEARLNKADFGGAVLDGASFEGARLAKANFKEASLVGADFRRATLDGADFSGATLDNANLADQWLKSVNLEEASLRGTNLSGAHFTSARLSNACLVGADLGQARVLSGLKLEDADLSGAKLVGFKGKNAKLRRAKLTGADLEGASFYEADLREVVLDDANLKDSKVQQSNLLKASLRHANLTGADWYCSRLRKTDLTGANLAGAQLRRVDFEDACLENVTQTDTNFEGASALVLARPKPVLSGKKAWAAQLSELRSRLGKSAELLEAVFELYENESFTSEIEMWLGGQVGTIIKKNPSTVEVARRFLQSEQPSTRALAGSLLSEGYNVAKAADREPYFALLVEALESGKSEVVMAVRRCKLRKKHLSAQIHELVLANLERNPEDEDLSVGLLNLVNRQGGPAAWEKSKDPTVVDIARVLFSSPHDSVRATIADRLLYLLGDDTEARSAIQASLFAEFIKAANARLDRAYFPLLFMHYAELPEPLAERFVQAIGELPAKELRHGELRGLLDLLAAHPEFEPLCFRSLTSPDRNNPTYDRETLRERIGYAAQVEGYIGLFSSMLMECDDAKAAEELFVYFARVVSGCYAPEHQERAALDRVFAARSRAWREAGRENEEAQFEALMHRQR